MPLTGVCDPFPLLKKAKRPTEPTVPEREISSLFLICLTNHLYHCQVLQYHRIHKMASYLTIQLFLIFACFVASSYQCQGSILTATSSPAFLEGTECDDVFITGNGNTVQIYAGRGSDRVVLGSNQAVWIADFSDNEDSLDASALPSWGTVASEGDFSISSSSNGAVILQRSTIHTSIIVINETH